MPETGKIDYLAHLGNIRRHGRPARFDVETGAPIAEVERDVAQAELLKRQLIEVTPGGLVLTRKGWHTLVISCDTLNEIT